MQWQRSSLFSPQSMPWIFQATRQDDAFPCITRHITMTYQHVIIEVITAVSLAVEKYFLLVGPHANLGLAIPIRMWYQNINGYIYIYMQQLLVQVSQRLVPQESVILLISNSDNARIIKAGYGVQSRFKMIEGLPSYSHHL